MQAAECRVGRELEQVNRNLSNFVWAILSNSQWQLPDEQLAALMECVRLQPVTLPQHHTIVLLGLMRYADFKGVAAVRPYVEEGGTAEVVLNRLLSQLATLDRQACSETLIRWVRVLGAWQLILTGWRVRIRLCAGVGA